MNRRAFTLIELLTVIAILAILAAALFPVFFRAKVSAHQTTDLSNVKQIGLAMILYQADNEDNFPTYVASLCEGARITNPIDPTDGPGQSSGMGRHPMWQSEIYPYLKSWSLFFSPGANIPSNTVAAYHNLSYGYNYGYLSKLELSPDPSGCGVRQWFSSISNAGVESPSCLIAFADSAGAAAFGNKPSLFGSMVNPPDAQNSSEHFFGRPQKGWGLTCRNNFYGTDFVSTDGFDPRFSGGGNLAFVDGHAKFAQTSGAASGTNFDQMLACDHTKVTDKSKYLWDPRGSSAPNE